tara:strand:- start:3563 stop:3982 length:420 start_codon:yes stop_codon:yes gene_type:complete
MKNLILTFALAFTTIGLLAQEKTGKNITVTIDHIQNNNGKVLVSLHTNETFMKGPGVQNLESKIEDGKVVLNFENVPSGEYAILVLHDENENGKMDFESNGMPIESYGMSGNEMSMGPPIFSSAKFSLTNDDLKFNIRF